MAETPSVRSVVRDILFADPELPMDEVVRRAKARGLKATPEQIKHAAGNFRGEARRSGAVKIPPAGRSAPIAVPGGAAGVTGPLAGAAGPLAGALAVVAEVHAVVRESGGAANTRRVAEAVRAAGGVDEFLAVLGLVETVMEDRVDNG